MCDNGWASLNKNLTGLMFVDFSKFLDNYADGLVL